MPARFQILLLFISLTWTPWALSHGEDQPGPHGGLIRMPGAFHIEVVPQGTQTLKIYLLDIEFKNPTTKNSKVVVAIHQLISNVAQCKVVSNYFQCQFADSVSLNVDGTMSIHATRDDVAGMKMDYKLPLSIPKKRTTDPHSGH